MTKQNAFDRITARIVESLESGTAPWRKPWSNGNPDSTGTVPCGAVSGRPYNGLNRLVLTMEALEKGYASNLWITPKAAMEAGLDIKGTKTTEIAFWKRSTYIKRDESGNKEEKASLLARSYRVLNLEQCQGDKSKFTHREPQQIVITTTEMATAILTGLGLRAVDHGGDRAFYAPSLDAIKMPPLQAFASDEAYKATLLHEAGHATGAAHRLNREFGARFGDQRYAFEELVAELTSVFVGDVMNLPCDVPNHASYLAGWITVLKSDSKAILTASSKAQAAANMILAAINPKAAEEMQEAA